MRLRAARVPLRTAQNGAGPLWSALLVAAAPYISQVATTFSDAGHHDLRAGRRSANPRRGCIVAAARWGADRKRCVTVHRASPRRHNVNLRTDDAMLREVSGLEFRVVLRRFVSNASATHGDSSLICARSTLACVTHLVELPQTACRTPSQSGVVPQAFQQRYPDRVFPCSPSSRWDRRLLSVRGRPSAGSVLRPALRSPAARSQQVLLLSPQHALLQRFRVPPLRLAPRLRLQPAQATYRVRRLQLAARGQAHARYGCARHGSP